MVAPQLWKISVTCVPALAGPLEDLLSDAALAVTVLTPPRRDTALVEAIYAAPPDASAWALQIAVLAAATGCTAPTLKIEEVGDLDWLKKVATDFPPLPIARWVVYGAAHKDKIRNPRSALQIDATSAFGTGEHPTTRGCLLLLDRLLKDRRMKRRRMLDVGCGSGILAMAFGKSCRGRAVAVDLDPQAVGIAAENVRVNGLRSLVRTGRSFGYTCDTVRAAAPFDLIMANIFARPLCLMARDLQRHLRPGGYAILSGILNHQANGVLAAHRAQGLFLVKRLVLGEWSALLLRREG